MLTLEGVDAFYGDLQALHGVSLEVDADGPGGLPPVTTTPVMNRSPGFSVTVSGSRPRAWCPRSSRP